MNYLIQRAAGEDGTAAGAGSDGHRYGDTLSESKEKWKTLGPVQPRGAWVVMAVDQGGRRRSGRIEAWRMRWITDRRSVFSGPVA